MQTDASFNVPSSWCKIFGPIIDGKISQKSIREFFPKNQTIRNQENIENVSGQIESENWLKQKYFDDLVTSTKKKMNRKINHFAYDINYSTLFEFLCFEILIQYCVRNNRLKNCEQLKMRKIKFQSPNLN
ncbi:hypothetical protein BpHYR1_008163 [Brachionus plicatilis]|uniref:Uncharacterized protein n=1 Tax=Brachionus plicatilis TaxID=10195 RepID=A0A3M7PR78_BRAPC|nr:hypothetical protein BpHYR1_008163 [Brachionus plicatilis]